jgi:GT2 family glycosyltransferase
MKKILIVCVNYNTYDHLINYLDSIEIAKINCSDCILNVYIADNSSKKQEIIIEKYQHINIKVFLFNNLGYLGGASAIINEEIKDISVYDYVIISNVDVALANNVLSELIKSSFGELVAWISPQRFSTKKNIVLHVEKKERPSKLKIYLTCLIYKYPFLRNVQNMLAWQKYVKMSSQPLLEEQIYVGCGSFIILTKTFFKHYKRIEYPVFLYGEELYLAELIYQKKLKVMYSPNILVFNEGEVSTSVNSIKQTCKYQYQAIKYIKDNFYSSKKS